jgi:hypothetical protein
MLQRLRAVATPGGAEVDGPAAPPARGPDAKRAYQLRVPTINLADLTVATRSGIVNARLRIKLITPRPPQAAAAAKTVILRIAFSHYPQTQMLWCMSNTIN